MISVKNYDRKCRVVVKFLNKHPLYTVCTLLILFKSSPFNIQEYERLLPKSQNIRYLFQIVISYCPLWMFTCFDLLSKCFPAHFASAGPDLTPADRWPACCFLCLGHPSTKFNPATKKIYWGDYQKKSNVWLFIEGGPYNKCNHFGGSPML